MINLSYEYLKSLPKDQEYRFKLFDVIGSIYCALSYNEDLEGKICLDLFDHGFTGQCYYYNYRTKYQQDTFYNLNKKNFVELMKLADFIKTDILENINNNQVIDDLC